MSKKITSDTVVSYHKYMAKTFGFKIFDKSNAIEMQWWYDSTIPNLTKMAEKLYYYGLEPNDQIMVRAHLQIHTPIARRGQIPNNFVAKKGIAWLNRHCK